jgi:hypothetical protein
MGEQNMIYPYNGNVFEFLIQGLAIYPSWPLLKILLPHLPSAEITCLHHRVTSYNGILFSHKKNRNANVCYNTREPWKYHAKWKKPVPETTDYMSSYMNVLHRKLLNTKSG